jgi:hypothetical protein
MNHIPIQQRPLVYYIENPALSYSKGRVGEPDKAHWL